MSETRTVMQTKAVSTVYADLKSEVDEKGRFFCDIEVVDSGSLGVLNARESTNVVKLELPDSHYKYATALASATAELETVNSKYFHIINTPNAAKKKLIAKKLLEILNAKDPSYTDKKVKVNSLFYALIQEAKEYASYSSEYKIEIVDPNNRAQCAEVSHFQVNTLKEFRELNDQTILDKVQLRYLLDAFMARVISPEITVFYVKQHGKILGTFTLNRHITEEKSELDKFGYLSDLFVASGLYEDDKFITQFIGGVFAKIATEHPAIRVLTVMAATDDPKKPILKCFKYAEQHKLISLLTRDMQEELGVVAQFTWEPKLNADRVLRNYTGPDRVSTSSMFKRSVLMNKPVFVWDIGGVILDWDPPKFAKDYEGGKFENACLTILTSDNWKKFDRGDVSYADMLNFYSNELKLEKSRIDHILQAAFHSLSPNWPVINIIKQLKEAGYEQYCLTNGSEEYWDHIRSEKYKAAYGFSISELFSDDQTVLSARIKMAKPESGIYKHLEAKFKLLGRKIIFIDDNKANSQGALDAGWWQSIHFESFEECMHKLRECDISVAIKKELSIR